MSRIIAKTKVMSKTKDMLVAWINNKDIVILNLFQDLRA